MSRRASLAIARDPAESAEPVRVATYTRISTDEARQPNSLEAQRVRLEAFVNSQPEWGIERRYEDQFTGTVIDRPALTRLLKDARLGRFDVLLVYRVDRLARSIRGLAQIIDELDQAGVIFRSATEPFDTGTPAGRMMVQMLGVFAEFERALIVERITAGLERKAARGGWCGGQRPFGLNIAADRDHLERNPTEAPLVPVIFDEYVHRKAGSSAIASWLNEQGYRTKNGRLWSQESVITVLRNRVYIGEIYYRGNWYPAPHEPLIPTELFDKAQAILTERCEDHSKRAATPAEYLLTGRVRCGRCGQAYVGTAAHGRNGRYTYYTCFTRARYGTEHCANDRLPAERLEQAVTRRLWQVLDDNDLIDHAITETYERLTQREGEQQSELAGIQDKLTETRAALDRYFRAFEAGTMPEDTCAPRIASLSEQAKALERRASELATQQDDDEQPERASAADLDALRGHLRFALNDSDPKRVKGVLQAMIDGIRVDARDQIEPTFRVPAVRIVSGYMDPGSSKSNQHSCDLHKDVSEVVGVLSSQELQGSLRHLAKKLATVRATGGAPRRPVSRRQRSRRPGWVLKAVVQVLTDRGEPMRAKEIHAAVEALVGEPVGWSSVKMALASNVSGSSPRFVRIARGRYVLP
jgi:site-specific DNA recombinase